MLLSTLNVCPKAHVRRDSASVARDWAPQSPLSAIQLKDSFWPIASRACPTRPTDIRLKWASAPRMLTN